MIFLLILTFMLAAWLEVPELIRKKWWSELIVFLSSLFLEFIISILLIR